MGKHPLHLQMGHLGDGKQLLQRLLPLLAEKAQAGHARIQLQMDLQPGADTHQAALQLPGIGQAVDLLTQVHLHQVPGVLGRCVPQNEDRAPHLRPAQLHRLFQIGYRQELRPQLLQMMAHGNCTVSIGVCLHHTQKAAGRRHLAPQDCIVVGQIVQ